MHMDGRLWSLHATNIVLRHLVQPVAGQELRGKCRPAGSHERQAAGSLPGVSLACMNDSQTALLKVSLWMTVVMKVSSSYNRFMASSA